MKLEKDDVYVSYLPMAHTLEKSLFNTCLAYGVRIGVYSGDTQKINDDMKLLKPTVFVSVPRVFNKIYSAMMKKINSSLLRRFVTNAINSKLD